MSTDAMKRFLIDTSVNNAEGSQVWYVDATSEAEALEKYEQGDCDLYASEVDVTSLGEPEISGETTLDDFGDFAEQPAQPLTDELWGLLDAIENELNRRAIPEVWLLMAHKAGRAYIEAKGAKGGEA